jgi:hypothetical protein
MTTAIVREGAESAGLGSGGIAPSQTTVVVSGDLTDDKGEP